MANKKQVHKADKIITSREEYMQVQKAYIEEQVDLYKKDPGAFMVPEFHSGRGGRREGAGRKKGQRIKEDFELKKARSIRMTDEEYPQVLEYLKQLRAEKKAEGKDAKSNQDNN